MIKKIKDKEIKRNASEQNPAYYIKGDNDKHVLKLHSELINI
ncbi:HVA1 family protein [Rickettsia bellii]